MLLRKKPQPHILRDIGVLILVHQDIAEPALVLGQHVVMGLENCHHMEKEIAEIGGIEGPKPLLIGLIELDAHMVEG